MLFIKQSLRAPVTNRSIVLLLRSVFKKASSSFSIDLHWVRGHSSIGGNFRVDRIAKAFGKRSVVTPAFNFDSVSFEHCLSDWSFGFPLSALPSHIFEISIPRFPWLSKPPLSSVASFAPVRTKRYRDCSCADFSLTDSVPFNTKRSKVWSSKFPLSPVASLAPVRSKRYRDRSCVDFYITDSEPLDFKHSEDS
jgi:hypothetical protein